MRSTANGSSSVVAAESNSSECIDCLVVVNIARAVPLEYALPLYGYLMPVLVAITSMTNSFIILVLSQKHLRTPTNFVLLSMALVDLLTGLSSLPWFVYYYTMRGYLHDAHEGMSSFWCHTYPFLSQILPSTMHTAGIWMTVWLAIQRYVYVCVPGCIHRVCTPKTTRLTVLLIVALAFLAELPNLFGKRMEQMELGGGRTICILRYSSWVLELMGIDLFYSFHYWFRVTLVHLVPCLLLIVFTYKLASTIRRSEIRRRSCFSYPIEQQAGQTHTPQIHNNPPAKRSCPAYIPPRTLSPSPAAAAEHDMLDDDVNAPPPRTKTRRTTRPSLIITSTAASIDRGVELGRRLSSLVSTSSPCGAGGPSGRSLHATNKMLAVICGVFLLLEVPAAFIFILHFLLAAHLVPNTPGAYRVLNVALIIRNILIVLTSPIQFGIYCSMSEQFRLTVRQLFSSRLLFVAQAQATFHGGKRYSLILVDVDTLKRAGSSRIKRASTSPVTTGTPFRRKLDGRGGGGSARHVPNAIATTSASIHHSTTALVAGFNSTIASTTTSSFRTSSLVAQLAASASPQQAGGGAGFANKPYALALAIIPLLTMFGNCLVIAAVWREKSLHTVTNYLIVSLAVSDLLVATCVMSFAVYFEWNSFVWDLGPALCNLYIGADVACSTASILNLLAISLDRYIAISHPLLYTQYGASTSRALVSILVVWLVSAGVAVPIFLGANKMDGEQLICEFTNPFFIIISSLLSFFLPCAAMLALYAIIFRRLRQRERARRVRNQMQRPPHPRQHMQRRSRNRLQVSQSDYALRIENERISSALVGGVRMARQMGNHLKSKADQLLLELSLQTYSFPTATATATSTSTDDFCSVTTTAPVVNSRTTQCNGGPPPPAARVLKIPTSVSGDTPLLGGQLWRQSTRPPRLYSKHHRTAAAKPPSIDNQHLCRSNTMPLQRRPLPLDEVPSAADTLPEIGGRREVASADRAGMSVGAELGTGMRRSAEMVKNDARSASFGENLQLEDCPFIDSISRSASYEEGSALDSVQRPTTAASESASTRLPLQLLTSISAVSSLFLLTDMPTTRLDSAPGSCWGGGSLSSIVPPPPPSPSPSSPPPVAASAEPAAGSRDATLPPQQSVYQRRRIMANAQRPPPPPPLRVSISNGNLNANRQQRMAVHQQSPTTINPSVSAHSALNKTPTSMATSSGAYDEPAHRANTSSSSSDALWTLFDCWRFTTTMSHMPVNKGQKGSTTPLNHDQSAKAARMGGAGTPLNVKAVETIAPSTATKISRQGGLRAQVSMSLHEMVWTNWLWRRLTSTLRRSAIRQVAVDKMRPSRHLAKKASKQMRREQKATVTLAVVLVVFLGCWVPFFTLHLSNAICILMGRENCVHFLAMFLSTWLGYFNSSLNPLIYTLFDARFRKAFRTILRCRTTHG